MTPQRHAREILADLVQELQAFRRLPEPSELLNEAQDYLRRISHYTSPPPEGHEFTMSVRRVGPNVLVDWQGVRLLLTPAEADLLSGAIASAAKKLREKAP